MPKRNNERIVSEDSLTAKDLEDTINELGAQINQASADIEILERVHAGGARRWKIAVRSFSVMVGLLMTYMCGAQAIYFADLGANVIAALSGVIGVAAPFLTYKVSQGFDEVIDAPGRKLSDAKYNLKGLIFEKNRLMNLGKYTIDYSIDMLRGKEQLKQREQGLALLRQLEAATSVEQVKELLRNQPELDAKAKKFLLKIASLNLQHQGAALQAQIQTTQGEVLQAKQEVKSTQERVVRRNKRLADKFAEQKEAKRLAYLEKHQNQK